MKDRLIRNLSKGYRQRVGIAQALIGNPEVIILDEPTVGLDPRQIIEIRELIRELGKKHTVILSSHILSEVSAICDEILILSGGRLVADDTPENLTALFAEQNGIHLTVKGALADVLSALNGLEGVEIADSREEDGRARLTLRARVPRTGAGRPADSGNGARARDAGGRVPRADRQRQGGRSRFR